MAIYDSETVNFIKDSFGYDSEILELNAHAAMKMYGKDLFSDDDYYYYTIILYSLFYLTLGFIYH